MRWLMVTGTVRGVDAASDRERCLLHRLGQGPWTAAAPVPYSGSHRSPGGPTLSIIPPLLCLALLVALPTRATAEVLTGDLDGVHDPAVVRGPDGWYLFGTGAGIPTWWSPDLRRWTRRRPVLPTALPPWAAAIVPGTQFPWAPDLSWWGGRWHLYHSISTFGSQTSAIGLLTSPALGDDARWTDEGVVLTSDTTSPWNAIDPNPVVDEQGVPWLAWGSFWGGIFLQQLDPATGKLAPGTLAHRLATRDPWVSGIEAPYLVRRGDHWYLFAAYGWCCRGTASTYNIRVGRSAAITGPYADDRGRPLLADGGTLVLGGYGDVRGPGHQAVVQDGERWWLVHHWYDAARGGVPTLGLHRLLWRDDGWPVAAPADFEPAPAVPPGRSLRGTWHLEGYEADFLATPASRTLVLRARAGARHPRRGRAWSADGRARGRWEWAHGQMRIALRDRCAGSVMRLALWIDAGARRGAGRDADGTPWRAVHLGSDVGRRRGGPCR